MTAHPVFVGYVIGAVIFAALIVSDVVRNGWDPKWSIPGQSAVAVAMCAGWPIYLLVVAAILAREAPARFRAWRAERSNRPRRRRPANAYRWSDNDRYWWRLTYANENRPDGRGREERRVFGLYITSKGEEGGGSFCLLRGHLLGHTLILRLPALFKPAREWREIKHEPTRTQMLRQGRKPGYWDTWERRYGFLFVMGALHVDYGAQTHDSSTDKTKVWFLPWRAWRHVRFSIYDLAGKHVWSQFDKDRPTGREPGADGGAIAMRPGGWWDQRGIAEQAAPKMAFEFLDFDKERLTATTQIHEHEWHKGEGRFSWLSWFVPAKVERSLSIQFSDETGRRKGSWKGGTIGHSISMQLGELHEAAFARYAKLHEMTYPCPSHDDAVRVEPQSMSKFINIGAIEVVGDDAALVPSPGILDSEVNKDFRDPQPDVASCITNPKPSTPPPALGFAIGIPLAAALWAAVAVIVWAVK